MANNLSPGEKLDPVRKTDEGIMQTFLDALHDQNNGTRKKIIGILCPPVYASVSMEKQFPALKGDLLEACDSNPELLSAMLATEFIDGFDPISWTIYQLPQSLLDSVHDQYPPVLADLLECSYQDPKALNSIHRACAKRNASALFQLFNLAMAANPKPYSVSHIRGTNYADFTIYNFPEQMFINKGVEVQFVFQSQIWVIEFTTVGEWQVQLRVVQHSKGEFTSKDVEDLIPVGLALILEGKNGMTGTWSRIGFSCPLAYMTSPSATVIAQDSKLRYANPFVGNDRVFCGRLRLTRHI